MTGGNKQHLLNLTVLEAVLGVCRLEPGGEIPGWACREPFFSITRTSEELSVICPEPQIPEGLRCERGWRAIKLEGPFDFGQIGVLLAIAEPLAEAGISILAQSTFDTDYVLVRAEQLQDAVAALGSAGHRVGFERD